MPGPWINVARLRVLVADAMATVETKLAPKWTEIIERSNDSAAADITAILIGRGYTIGQIDLWDRRIEFNEDLGLFWCFTRAGLAATYSDVMLNKLDRRKELKDLAITVGGVIITPGGGELGPDGSPIQGGNAVAGGRFDQCDFLSTKFTTVF